MMKIFKKFIQSTVFFSLPGLAISPELFQMWHPSIKFDATSIRSGFDELASQKVHDEGFGVDIRVLRFMILFTVTILMLFSPLIQAKVCSGVSDLRSEAQEQIQKLEKDRDDLKKLLQDGDMQNVKIMAATLGMASLKIADVYANSLLSAANPVVSTIQNQIKLVANTIINSHETWDSTLNQVNNIKSISGVDHYLLSTKLNDSFDIFMAAVELKNISSEASNSKASIDAAKASANRVLAGMNQKISILKVSAAKLPNC